MILIKKFAKANVNIPKSPPELIPPYIKLYERFENNPQTNKILIRIAVTLNT